jgi:UDP-GlcNAc:undecaprenyl-phosphate GlcNAc-1-phosphate transferase
MRLDGNACVLLAYPIALAVSCAATPLARRLALRTGAIDHPNERKVHKAPIASSGGVAIIAGFYAAAIFSGAIHQAPLRAFLGLSAGAVFIAAVGFVDDRIDIPARIKLVLQVLGELLFPTRNTKSESDRLPCGPAKSTMMPLMPFE